ncbi:2-dehydro-3-deoxy-D-gluconate 5-dehydrogenase [Colletotrichum orbiculare MAFF 240422]|uniref:2-dehydro-3-deoxy-D-gluconate 5-dehydrogenase n=1 Tax=Colletotrichum orbiculare (strain 104-T / ATCC 96160 / CBS 514.97 / LARS 414 / MAFF 240422) TaxID=1213857 RepID=N4VFV3_COLOR|nr:2-dehydro-3-deoxy-D-gluconate 5-dehydrogenase [Colletotrichum orbiculare MAFF 240422]
MSPSATADNGNGAAPPAAAPAASSSSSSPSTNPEFLNTQPGPDHDWKISLRGKVIAITGANRGIGLGIAEVCLANDAAAVYSLDLFEPGDEFRAVQQANPKRLQYVHTDVTKEDSITAAVDAIVAREGAVHGLVANAGMTRHQPALDFDRAQLEQLFNLNVFGAYFCATTVARRFIELGVKGSIVFTASMTSYRPNRAAPSAPYGATKGAVRNMTHTLAMEWAKHGIRVNSISPGFVKTAMTYFVDQAPDWNLKMQYYGGMPRLADPKELGGAYVYLLSDGASYTTGIDIPVAGIVGAW